MQIVPSRHILPASPLVVYEPSFMFCTDFDHWSDTRALDAGVSAARVLPSSLLQGILE